MRKLSVIAAAAAVLSVPAQAGDAPNGAGAFRAGAFVGARVKLSLGAGPRKEFRAALTVAPTRSYQSDAGRVVTRVGEGVALDFAGRGPTLMVGGAPANALWRLRPHGELEADQRLGLSTGAWIAVGTLATVATVVAITELTCIGKDEEFCGSD